MILPYLFCNSLALDICFFKDETQKLCPNVSTFDDQIKADAYIKEICYPSSQDLNLYIAGDVNFLLREVNTYNIKYLRVLGLGTKNTVSIYLMLNSEQTLFENIELNDISELTHFSSETSFMNCKVMSQSLPFVNQLIIDLNTLNSLSTLISNNMSIVMKGETNVTVSGYYVSVINFLEVPNDTEFVLLGYKVIARQKYTNKLMVSVISFPHTLSFYIINGSNVKLTSVICNRPSGSGTISMCGDSVSLEITGNQWEKSNIFLNNLTNSKVFFNCSYAPHLLTPHSNQNELHFIKKTTIGALSTCSIFSDSDNASISIDELIVDNSSVFNIFGQALNYMSINLLTVRSESDQLDILAESLVPILYPKYVQGISILSMKRVVFDEFTVIEVPTYICQFEETADDNITYQFCCNKMVQYKEYQLFRTSNPSFKYEFVLTKDENFYIAVNITNSTITVQTPQKPFQNSFCNELYITQNMDCYILDDFEKYINYSYYKMELVALNQPMEVPSLLGFTNPISLTIYSNANVLIRPEFAHKIENLSLVSSNRNGRLYVDYLDLYNLSSTTFLISGQVRSVYFYCDFLGIDKVSTDNYIFTDSQMTTIQIVDDIIYVFKSRYYNIIHRKGTQNMIFNIYNSPNLVIEEATNLPIEFNFHSCNVVYTNRTSIFINFVAERESTITKVSLSYSQFVIRTYYQHIGVLITDVHDSIISFIEQKHIIVNYPIDISRNVSFKASLIEFTGSRTLSSDKASDSCGCVFSHLVLSSPLADIFETGSLTLDKGAILQSSSVLHAYDRINITMSVGLHGTAFLVIFQAKGIGPRVTVEIDEDIYEQIKDNNTIEYFKYGIPIASIQDAKGAVLSKDWIIEIVTKDQNGNRITVDEFEAKYDKHNSSIMEIIEIFPVETKELEESEYARKGEEMMHETIALLVADVFLIIIGMVIFKLQTSQKNKSNENHLDMNDIE